MNALRDLYQEVILDHGRRPRNFGHLEDPTHQAEGVNPLCGDHLRLELRVESDRVAGAAFAGAGCAISKASASLMTQAVPGRSVSEARELFDAVHRLLTTGQGSAAEVGKLAVFSGVRGFPARVKCATLAWHTLLAALDGSAGPVTTE